MQKARKRLESQRVGRPLHRAREGFRHDLLTEWMDEEGLSARGLATELEQHGQRATHWAIYKWMRGTSRPSRAVRVALAKLMKLRSHKALDI